MEQVFSFLGVICFIGVLFWGWYQANRFRRVNRELEQRKVNEILSQSEAEIINMDIPSLIAQNNKRYSAKSDDKKE